MRFEMAFPVLGKAINHTRSIAVSNKQEIGVGIFFLVFSAIYFGLSFQIQYFDPFGNSPITSRNMPQVLGLTIFVLSFIHIISSVFKLQKEKEVRSESSIKDNVIKTFFSRRFRLMVITILLICAYLFFYNRLGFVLSSILYLLAQFFILTPKEKRKKWAILIVCLSAAIPAILFTLFTKVLSIWLPFGFLWW